MSLKEVTYWTVGCDEPGCGRALGDYTDIAAWAEPRVAIEDWVEDGGKLTVAGKAYCHEHVFGKVCDYCGEIRETKDSGDGDRICAECKAEVWS